MTRDTPPAGPMVNCPSCRKQLAYSTENAWRPFCSERCRLADLGAWATEKFRLAAAPPEDDDDAPNPGA